MLFRGVNVEGLDSKLCCLVFERISLGLAELLMENDDGMSQFGKVALGRLRCSPKGPRTQIMGLESPNVGPLGQDTRKPYKDCTCYLFALPQAPLARFLLVLINSWGFSPT